MPLDFEDWVFEPVTYRTIPMPRRRELWHVTYRDGIVCVQNGGTRWTFHDYAEWCSLAWAFSILQMNQRLRENIDNYLYGHHEPETTGHWGTTPEYREQIHRVIEAEEQRQAQIRREQLQQTQQARQAHQLVRNFFYGQPIPGPDWVTVDALPERDRQQYYHGVWNT